MAKSKTRRTAGWELLLYIPLTVITYTVYDRRMFAGEVTQVDLPHHWWTVQYCFFAANILLLNCLWLLWRYRARAGFDRREWRAFICGTLPVVTVLQFEMLLFQYPISTRLASAGLANLSDATFAMFLIVASSSPYLWRDLGQPTEQSLKSAHAENGGIVEEQTN